MNISIGKEKSSEKLARYVIIAIFLAIAFLICKLFGNVIMYILGAAIVSLVGRPLMTLMGKIRIRNKPLPSWLCALVTILLVVSVFLGIFFLVTPVFTGIASDISKANLTDSAKTLIKPLRRWNEYLRATFPALGADFKIENFMFKNFTSFFDVSKFSNIISGLTSFLASFGVGLFSIIFIAFFFVKDEKLFANIVASLIPDEYEVQARDSMREIGNLMSRYFSGIVIEMLGVAFLDFLGLFLIAKMGVKYSIGIAFLAGLLNIIPYLGPLMGEALGVILAVIIKYCCASSYGLDVNVVPFILIILAIMLCTQLVDNVVYQPLIYSSSIKAHPLEVFIVLLLGGSFGGILGMLIAVPAYTVLRVIAIHFFGDAKVVKRLTGAPEGDKNKY